GGPPAVRPGVGRPPRATPEGRLLLEGDPARPLLRRRPDARRRARRAARRPPETAALLRTPQGGVRDPRRQACHRWFIRRVPGGWVREAQPTKVIFRWWVALRCPTLQRDPELAGWTTEAAA